MSHSLLTAVNHRLLSILCRIRAKPANRDRHVPQSVCIVKPSSRKALRWKPPVSGLMLCLGQNDRKEMDWTAGNCTLQLNNRVSKHCDSLVPDKSFVFEWFHYAMESASRYSSVMHREASMRKCLLLVFRVRFETFVTTGSGNVKSFIGHLPCLARKVEFDVLCIYDKLPCRWECYSKTGIGDMHLSGIFF